MCSHPITVSYNTAEYFIFRGKQNTHLKSTLADLTFVFKSSITKLRKMQLRLSAIDISVYTDKSLNTSGQRRRVGQDTVWRGSPELPRVQALVRAVVWANNCSAAPLPTYTPLLRSTFKYSALQFYHPETTVIILSFSQRPDCKVFPRGACFLWGI